MQTVSQDIVAYVQNVVRFYCKFLTRVKGVFHYAEHRD